MEDKRIRKTKKTLKTTLIKMLKEETFDQVSITELCKNADISRITFYSHYSDKFALVDDIFADMQEIGYADYRRRQQEYNPSGSVVQGYVNVLDTILDLYYARFDFFRHTDPEKNPYLAFAFYNIVLDTVEQHTSHIEQRNLKLKYSARKIAGFVCFGLLGFINECHQEENAAGADPGGMQGAAYRYPAFRCGGRRRRRTEGFWKMIPGNCKMQDRMLE